MSENEELILTDKIFSKSETSLMSTVNLSTTSMSVTCFQMLIWHTDDVTQ